MNSVRLTTLFTAVSDVGVGGRPGAKAARVTQGKLLAGGLLPLITLGNMGLRKYWRPLIATPCGELVTVMGDQHEANAHIKHNGVKKRNGEAEVVKC